MFELNEELIKQNNLSNAMSFLPNNEEVTQLMALTAMQQSLLTTLITLKNSQPSSYSALMSFYLSNYQQQQVLLAKIRQLYPLAAINCNLPDLRLLTKNEAQIAISSPAVASAKPISNKQPQLYQEAHPSTFFAYPVSAHEFTEADDIAKQVLDLPLVPLPLINIPFTDYNSSQLIAARSSKLLTSEKLEKKQTNQQKPEGKREKGREAARQFRLRQSARVGGLEGKIAALEIEESITKSSISNVKKENEQLRQRLLFLRGAITNIVDGEPPINKNNLPPFAPK